MFPKQLAEQRVLLKRAGWPKLHEAPAVEYHDQVKPRHMLQPMADGQHRCVQSKQDVMNGLRNAISEEEVEEEEEEESEEASNGVLEC